MFIEQLKIKNFKGFSGKFIKFSKSATQIAKGSISKLQEVSNSEFLIAGSCKTVIHIVIQKSCQNTKKPQQKHFYCGFIVVSPGIEPGTQGFSVLCSTN